MQLDVQQEWHPAAQRVFSPDSPTDLFSLIEKAFRGREQKICLTDVSLPHKHRAVSWRSLRRMAAQMANVYAAHGLKKGDGVFLLTRKSISAVAAQLASLMGGTLGVPGQVIPQNVTPEQAVSILRDIAAKRDALVRGGKLKDGGLLIIDPALEPYLGEDVRAKFKNVLTLGYEGDGTLGMRACHEPMHFERPVLGPKDKTFSLFTSGSSSGLPKGVIYTQQMLATNMMILKKWLEVKPGERALNALPINHLHGMMQQVLAMLVGGGHVMLMENFDAPHFINLMRQADIVSGVPAHWHQVLDQLARSPKDLSAFKRPRVFIAGSDRVGEALRQRFYKQTKRKLVVRGGSTEQGHAYGVPLANPDMGEGVGEPFDSYVMSLRDPENPEREVAPGELGELYMRGPCVVEEYVGNPEATAKAFTPHGYRSGDGFHLDPKTGQMIFVARLGDRIKSGAERFNPSDVEVFFGGLSQAAQLQCVGVYYHTLVANQLMDPEQDKGYGQRVVAVAVPAPGTDIEELKRAFLDHCARIPHAYLRPRELVIASRLPTSGPTKINPRLTRETIQTQGTLPGQTGMWTVTYGGKPPQLTPCVIRSRPAQCVQPEAREVVPQA